MRFSLSGLSFSFLLFFSFQVNLLYNRVNNFSIYFLRFSIDKRGKGGYNTIKPTNNVGLEGDRQRRRAQRPQREDTSMSKIYTSADQLIGHTPLLELTHIEKEQDLKATILA